MSLGRCAVDGCERPATRYFTLKDGQPLARICDGHGTPELEPGWILRTALNGPPTLYPPGATLPPF